MTSCSCSELSAVPIRAAVNSSIRGSTLVFKIRRRSLSSCFREFSLLLMPVSSKKLTQTGRRARLSRRICSAQKAKSPAILYILSKG